MSDHSLYFCFFIDQSDGRDLSGESSLICFFSFLLLYLYFIWTLAEARPHLRAPPLRRGTIPYQGFDCTRSRRASLKRASASEPTVLNCSGDVLSQTVLYCFFFSFVGKDGFSIRTSRDPRRDLWVCDNRCRPQ